MANKPKRRRMRVQSVEEKMVFRLKEEYKCSIKDAWAKLKQYQFHAEMRRLNSNI